MLHFAHYFYLILIVHISPIIISLVDNNYNVIELKPLFYKNVIVF